MRRSLLCFSLVCLVACGLSLDAIQDDGQDPTPGSSSSGSQNSAGGSSGQPTPATSSGSPATSSGSGGGSSSGGESSSGASSSGEPATGSSGGSSSGSMEPTCPDGFAGFALAPNEMCGTGTSCEKETRPQPDQLVMSDSRGRLHLPDTPGDHSFRLELTMDRVKDSKAMFVVFFGGDPDDNKPSLSHTADRWRRAPESGEAAVVFWVKDGVSASWAFDDSTVNVAPLPWAWATVEAGPSNLLIEYDGSELRHWHNGTEGTPLRVELDADLPIQVLFDRDKSADNRAFSIKRATLDCIPEAQSD